MNIATDPRDASAVWRYNNWTSPSDSPVPILSNRPTIGKTLLLHMSEATTCSSEELLRNAITEGVKPRRDRLWPRPVANDPNWPAATIFPALQWRGRTAAKRIAAATTIDEVLSVVEECGMARAAKRIDFLSGLKALDPDEPEVDLESLRRLATAMIENPAWGEPQLTLSDEGYLHAEWSTVDKGRIAMTFLPLDLVDFAAISEPVNVGVEIMRISGRHVGVEAINAVRWFADRIDRR